MATTQKLLDYYLPPGDGFVLESVVATTFQVDFEFIEEELLAAALGVRSSVSRMQAFRSDFERRLQKTDVTILYDPAGCPRLARLSPRIDILPIPSRKLHSKITLLMWFRPEHDPQRRPERCLRLLVGSANLTRQGFRENYEVAACVECSSSADGPRHLILAGIKQVKAIAANSTSEQLARQLDAFTAEVSLMPARNGLADEPIALVSADDAVETIRSEWRKLSRERPERLTVVSPFWPEGSGAVNSLALLIKRLGSPASVGFICRAEPMPTGRSWLPVFDASVAQRLARSVHIPLTLQPTRPNIESEFVDDTDESGDDTEDSAFARTVSPAAAAQANWRHLHAKMLLLDGPHGAILYIGSSNCTARGLRLGGPTNWEAGLVYSLGPRRRKHIERMLAFAGNPVRVDPSQLPATKKPERLSVSPFPRFLEEVVAIGSKLTITFRKGAEVPAALKLLMEIPLSRDNPEYWLILDAIHRPGQLRQLTVDLATCIRCGPDFVSRPTRPDESPIMPNVQIEVLWDGNREPYPVRFDDKLSLPLLLAGRKPTEAELIEYFLLGHPPSDCEDGEPANDASPPTTDEPIDTRHILSYVVRQFVQALPGVEAEIALAAHSRPSLDSALRGPISVLALAEETYASLSRTSRPDEPRKTPTAVAFQLVEILGTLWRSRVRVKDRRLRECFTPVIRRCTELLESVVAAHAELSDRVFLRYRQQIAGGQS